MVERGCAYIAGLLTGVILMAGAAGLLVAIPSPAPEVTTVDQISEFSGVGRQTERIELPEGKYLLTDDGPIILWERISGKCDVPLADSFGNKQMFVIVSFNSTTSEDTEEPPITREIISEGCIIEIDFGDNTEVEPWTAKIERLP